MKRRKSKKLSISYWLRQFEELDEQYPFIRKAIISQIIELRVARYCELSHLELVRELVKETGHKIAPLIMQAIVEKAINGIITDRTGEIIEEIYRSAAEAAIRKGEKRDKPSWTYTNAIDNDIEDE